MAETRVPPSDRRYQKRPVDHIYRHLKGSLKTATCARTLDALASNESFMLLLTTSFGSEPSLSLPILIVRRARNWN